MNAARTGITPIAWLIAPSALLFALFFFLPMGLMAMISLLTGNPVVQPNVDFTTKYYRQDSRRQLLFRGDLDHAPDWPAHHAFGFADRLPAGPLDGAVRGRTAYAMLMMAVLTPMLTGIVVRTFAWMALLSDKGAINQALIGLGLISKPLPLMYNEFSIVLGLTHIYVPYMVLTLVGVIGRIDERLEHAAQNLGASPLRAFLEVTLPAEPARHPGRFAAGLCAGHQRLCHPILMGGFQIMTLPMLIYQQISSSFNVGFAAALGMVLLTISLVLVIAYNRILGLVSGQRDLQ
jgi:putative spermidine/putrescine transport system permease protein